MKAEQQVKKQGATHRLRAASCTAFGYRISSKTILKQTLCASHRVCMPPAESVCLKTSICECVPLWVPNPCSVRIAHQCVCACVGDGHHIVTADLLHGDVALEVGLKAVRHATRQAHKHVRQAFKQIKQARAGTRGRARAHTHTPTQAATWVRGQERRTLCARIRWSAIV